LSPRRFRLPYDHVFEFFQPFRGRRHELAPCYSTVVRT